MRLDEIEKHAIEVFTTDYPPVNSLCLLKMLEEILDDAKTNSFILASPKHKLLAVPFIIQLLDHVLTSPKFPVSFFNPKTILYLSSDKKDDELDVLESLCRKFEKAFIKKGDKS